MTNQEVVQNNTTIQQEKLWSWNFFLLWQGQIVSGFGNIIYQIALGFWILLETGSTAMMGTLMAVSSICRIVVAPFAGVIVDRTDRKKMIIWMDAIRGVVICLLAFSALKGYADIWMLFVAAVFLGVCGAFFTPACDSSIPDIVPKSKVFQANSVFSMGHTVANILGSPFGGFLFSVLGAPLIFLINGVSFIFSAITEIFIKIPKIPSKGVKTTFVEDLKDGFHFIWKFAGLRAFLIVAAAVNFFGIMAVTMILPLFQMTESLGAAKYGLTMGFFTMGSFLGMLFISVVQIPASKRLVVFMIASILTSLAISIFPFCAFWIIVFLLFVGGFFNAIVNVFLSAVVQMTVPANMRGKVLALMGTFLGSITPLGMAIGGVIAEFVDIRFVITGSFLITALISIVFAFIPSFKKFINFDPDHQAIEDIM